MVTVPKKHRPNLSCRNRTLCIRIRQLELASSPYRRSDVGCANALNRRSDGRYACGWQINKGYEPLWQAGLHLRQKAPRCHSDLVLAPALDVFDPQDKRIDLVLRQHEGWKVVSALQHVSDPGFARDGHARRDQVCNVSIDSPLGDLELGRNSVRSDRTPLAPKDLDNDIQSIRPSHQHPHGSLLTPCCQQAVRIK